MVGQLVIGLLCGFIYKKSKNKILHIAVTIAAVFIGIGAIKTGIECTLYSIPVAVKFSKNCVAFVADVIPMIFGLLIGYKVKRYVKEDN